MGAYYAHGCIGFESYRGLMSIFLSKTDKTSEPMYEKDADYTHVSQEFQLKISPSEDCSPRLQVGGLYIC